MHLSFYIVYFITSRTFALYAAKLTVVFTSISVAAERDSSKSLVVSLGVVLAALFITNVFLLVLLCKRERG